LKPYHKNPRTITDREQADLAKWLDELGDLSGIVHDLNSDETICGNQRVDVMGLLNASPVITERFDPPTRQGTVALGYFEKHGERYAYRAVRWTEKQCEKANICANSAGGDWDIEILAGWDGEELEEWGMDDETLAEILDEVSSPPTLDELAEQYGEPQERDFWPVIKVQVSPDTMELYQSFRDQIGVEDDADAMAVLLGAVDATVLGSGIV